MSEKSTNKEDAAADESQSSKTTYYFPEVGGTSFSVEADSPEEAQKLAEKVRKEQDNG